MESFQREAFSSLAVKQMRERLSVFCSVCADMSKSINIFRLFDCIRGIRDILFFSQVKQAEMHQSDGCKAQVCASMI